MHFMRAAIVAIAWMMLVCHSVRAADGNPIKVLVVLPEKLEPSKVYMMTDGELARGFTVPFAVIANSITLKRRSEELGQQLDTALQGYDRYDVIHRALVAKFAARSPGFELTQSRDVAKYLGDKGVAATAASEGFGYVLRIEDKFSGLSILNVATRTDDLAPFATLGFQLFDAKKRSRISKGNVSANGLQKKPFREAAGDREFFVSAYPSMADVLANQVVGTLFRTDVLHAMAKSVGRGAEVPQIASVMKKYERRFDYEFEPVKSWKHTKMNIKYANVLEPKSDLRYSMGLRFEVDLLIAEFGQAVSTLDEYVAIYLDRLADSGFDVTTFQEFKDINVPAEYRTYSLVTNAEGGRQIVLMRKLNDDMLEMVLVVFAKEFDTLYPAHRADIEQMIASAKLKVS